MNRATTRIRRISSHLFLASMLAGGAFGCGSDDDYRGLQPAHEEAVPNSDAQDAMTEEERKKQQIRMEQATEAKEFEEAQQQ